ncbi:MAG: HlyD family efflux transporter periplasmic adaptor subunit, partial [Phycisphaerales bacterium]
PVSDKPLRPFDYVIAGLVVVRLDYRPVLAALEVLRAEIGVSQAELLAEAVLWGHERNETIRDHEVTRQRLLIEVQGLQLDVLDRRTIIEADRIELRRVEHNLAGLEDLYAMGAETEFLLTQERLLRETLIMQIEEQEKALARAQAQLEDSTGRLTEIPQTLPDELDRLLAPTRAAIKVHEAGIRELEVLAEQLQIRAPISGMISAVYFEPGEVASPGLPVLTIASPEADSIVTYIREVNPIRPEVGATVELRPIHHRGSVVNATIEQVGTQVELVPEHQRRTPNAMEWGLPVLIAMPQELNVPPGELVRVRFR